MAVSSLQEKHAHSKGSEEHEPHDQEERPRRLKSSDTGPAAPGAAAEAVARRPSVGAKKPPPFSGGSSLVSAVGDEVEAVPLEERSHGPPGASAHELQTHPVPAGTCTLTHPSERDESRTSTPVPSASLPSLVESTVGSDRKFRPEGATTVAVCPGIRFAEGVPGSAGCETGSVGAGGDSDGDGTSPGCPAAWARRKRRTPPPTTPAPRSHGHSFFSSTGYLLRKTSLHRMRGEVSGSLLEKGCGRVVTGRQGMTRQAQEKPRVLRGIMHEGEKISR